VTDTSLVSYNNGSTISPDDPRILEGFEGGREVKGKCSNGPSRIDPANSIQWETYQAMYREKNPNKKIVLPEGLSTMNTNALNRILGQEASCYKSFAHLPVAEKTLEDFQLVSRYGTESCSNSKVRRRWQKEVEEFGTYATKEQVQAELYDRTEQYEDQTHDDPPDALASRGQATSEAWDDVWAAQRWQMTKDERSMLLSRDDRSRMMDSMRSEAEKAENTAKSESQLKSEAAIDEFTLNLRKRKPSIMVIRETLEDWGITPEAAKGKEYKFGTDGSYRVMSERTFREKEEYKTLSRLNGDLFLAFKASDETCDQFFKEGAEWIDKKCLIIADNEVSRSVLSSELGAVNGAETKANSETTDSSSLPWGLGFKAPLSQDQVESVWAKDPRFHFKGSSASSRPTRLSVADGGRSWRTDQRDYPSSQNSSR